MAKKTPTRSLSLEKILHRQGFGTRKMCRIMIISDEVTVNGALCDDPSAIFDLTDLSYNVQGEAWTYQANVYLIMHKPTHYECTHKTQHHPTIYSLLPHPLVARDVQSIGRLDEDTTGLLLISDDGQFIHKMSSPKHKVPKIYEVTCKHAVSDDDIAHILKGVQLVDEDAPIAALACTRASEHIIHMTLAEGKYHQVKRMVAAMGNRVEYLKRTQIGELRLPDDLAAGEWRYLTADEMRLLNYSHA